MKKNTSLLWLAAAMLALTILVCPQQASAQDAQFSQFYASPLYLNPAFAGSTGQTRVGINYRNQWPSVPASFQSSNVFIDHFIPRYQSGVGLLVAYDREGLAALRSISVGAQYAYVLKLSKKLTFRPGFQVGFTQRDINFNRLTFGDQFDQNGFIGIPTAETFNTGENRIFADLSAGGLLYAQNFWVGFAAHHLNTPDQSLLGEDPSRLPIRYSVHGGYKIPLRTNKVLKGRNMDGKERSMVISGQYKRQAPFSQLDIGAYAILEPVVIGLWYRGIPVGPEGLGNNESIVTLIGFTANKFNLGYSYDITISGLGSESGGAHEISLVYEFFSGDPRKPSYDSRRVPCPKF